MPREITDPEGIVWTCIEAFAGLGEGPARKAAAAEGAEVAVVCTPRGGARSVRLAMPPGWESLDDEPLLSLIAEARREADR